MSKFLDCYYRVSTKGQKDEGHSLESQIQLSKRVAKQLGLEIREHNEFAKSSTIKGVTRDKFEEIKTLIEQDKIKNLWVVEQERLFRKPSDAFFFKEYYLDEFKVTLYSGENPQPQQFGSEFDNEMFQFRALISGFESKKIRRRSIRGKRHLLDNYSQNKPIFLGGTPTFGYENKDKTWVINPEESKWVKWIFKSYADGLETISIKKELDLNGVKPRRTKFGLWNLQTIRVMLQNESYTGLKRWFDKEIKKEWTYKIPQIISVSLFQKVQKKLEENQKNKDNNKKHFFLLDGLLYCQCGSAMGSVSKKRPNGNPTEKYFCTTSYKKWRGDDVNECSNDKSLDRQLTDTQITKFVSEIVKDSNILKEQFKKDVLSEKKENDLDIKNEIKRLENKVKQIQLDLENTIKNISLIEFEILQGIKDIRVSDNILQMLNDTKDNLEKDYSKTFQDIENVNSKKDWLDWVVKYINDLNLKTKNEKKNRDFIKGLVKKIVVNVEKEDNKSIGQTFNIEFNMKIVNDKFNWTDKTSKPWKYEVIEGTNKKKSNLVNLEKGKGQPKKKLLNQVQSSNVHSKPISNCGVVLRGGI